MWRWVAFLVATILFSVYLYGGDDGDLLLSRRPCGDPPRQVASCGVAGMKGVRLSPSGVFLKPAWSRPLQVARQPDLKSVDLCCQEFEAMRMRGSPPVYHFGDVEASVEAWVRGCDTEAPAAAKSKTWQGSAGTVTHWHYDWSPGMLWQLEGRKRVHLLRPGAEAPLYPFSHPNGTYAYDLPASLVADYTYELGPGDSLSIPAMWLHRAESLSASVSVSLWWDSPEELAWRRILSRGAPASLQLILGVVFWSLRPVSCEHFYLRHVEARYLPLLSSRHKQQQRCASGIRPEVVNDSSMQEQLSRMQPEHRLVFLANWLDVALANAIGKPLTPQKVYDVASCLCL